MTNNQPIENQITTANYTCGNCGHSWVMKFGLNPPENVTNETVPNCIICTPETPQQTKGN